MDFFFTAPWLLAFFFVRSVILVGLSRAPPCPYLEQGPATMAAAAAPAGAGPQLAFEQFGVEALKAFIAEHGMGYTGLIEKHELVARAREADLRSKKNKKNKRPSPETRTAPGGTAAAVETACDQVKPT